MDAATPERWIPPAAETVVAVAEGAAQSDSVAWSDLLRRDPALSWFFFTRNSDLSLERSALALRSGIDSQVFLDAALAASQNSFADWSGSAAQLAYLRSQRIGAIAERLAVKVRLDPLLAHCLGQLSQLGPLVMSQNGTATKGRKDLGIQTRQLIRRASVPAWLRNILLALDLPIEGNDDSKGIDRWVWLLQMASGLASSPSPIARGRSATLQSTSSGAHHLAMSACKKLGLSWTDELEMMTDLLPPVSALVSASVSSLLVRTLRLQQNQPARTLSFTVNQLEKEVEDLRARLTKMPYLESEMLRQQKLTAVAELAAGAGHEINNPLAVISGQAQYLLKSEQDLNRAKSLERIIAQTNRIHVLLRDLMYFARPPKPHYRSTPVAKLIKSAIHQIADLALTRGVTIELEDLPAKLKLTIDPELVGTALRCLVQNGVEAAPANGWVRVKCRQHQGRLDIHVEDNGPGVPQQVQENVFDPFFSGRSAGRGVGLGLSKVWRIAQLHGGEVSLENKAGQPTRFTLKLPLKAARNQPTKPIPLKKPA
jgi:signal transduction histidine kinase